VISRNLSIITKLLGPPLTAKLKCKQSLQSEKNYWKSGMMAHQCHYCSDVFKVISQCYQHTRVAHKDAVQKYWIPCPNCQKYFPNKGSIIAHKKNSCLVCDHCSKLLTTRSQLINHVELNHPEEMAKYWRKCLVCDKKFRVGRSFTKHLNKCQQNQVICQRKEQRTCQECKKMFSTKQVMLVHARVMHVTHVELFWPSCCPDCKLTFLSMAEVEEHVCLVKLSSTKNDLNLDNIDVTLEWLLSKETKRNTARQNIEYQALLQY
jgi:hypothetical protein